MLVDPILKPHPISKQYGSGTGERKLRPLRLSSLSTTAFWLKLWSTSVPDRSKGPGNVNDENIILSRESTFQNKQCNNLAGITIDRFLPSIPNTKHIHNQNSKFLIPEDSRSDWVRGGIDTRQIIRHQNYKNKCN